MSKCREEFERLYGKQTLDKTMQGHYLDLEVARAWRYWKAAWNARGTVDGDACEMLRCMHEDGSGMLAACLDAIEQENEK